jgi:hypothetical protein
MNFLKSRIAKCIGLFAVCLSLTQNLKAEDKVYVRNAGLVILQSYIPMYFERLGLTKNNQFISPDSQIRAVHYLQFLATGQTETSDQFLTLNKILCGLSPETSVDIEFTPTQAEIEMTNGLIKAMINYWSAIGSSSVEGFRGNWLVRDGLLIEKSDRLELTVDKRAYDVLLAKSPFSFSVIKLPWMTASLYVNWPY